MLPARCDPVATVAVRAPAPPWDDPRMPASRRVRDLGMTIGPLPTGTHDAITDVAGVRVGHTTVHDGDRVHTGVTAVVPDQLGLGLPGRERATLPCGLFVGNGFGKLVGATQVAELGAIETPVVLTATLSAFRAADALTTWMLARPGYEDVRTLNPVVGETNDGLLSDVRARPVTEAHVLAALDGAMFGPVATGSVGAGSGTAALGYKGGIGTASRVVDIAGRAHTVGALVQSNFGGTLTVRGVPLPATALLAEEQRAAEAANGVDDGNSCMIVVATDAPLDARRLARVARRAVFAMGRVGADFSHGSGDYALAFSTAAPDAPLAADARLDPLFAATMDAVEEALLDSVFTATTMVGHRGTRHAVPLEPALARLRAAGVVAGE